MAHETDLVNLKRRRVVIQGSCTRIKTFVDALTSVSPSLVAQLEERRLKLDKYWSDYDKIQAEVELLDETETNHRAGFEETFFSLSARIRELVNTTLSTRGTSSSLHTSASNASVSLTRIRLPKINLPSFSGKFDEWFPFYDTFNAMIHANDNLGEIEKLQYLKASLTDDAANVISSLELSAVNYEVAWNLLKQRYDHKRVIVQKHMRAITDLPSMTKENGTELRHIANTVAKHVQALQALKRPTEHWDDLLVHILSDKLDPFTKREWQSSLTTSEMPTLKQFMEFVVHQCHTLEATEKSRGVSSKPVNSKTRYQTACIASAKLSCTYCRGEHSVYYCKDFLALSIPQRIAAMRKHKICVNCLRSKNHTSSKCQSGGCKTCGLKHNTLLHLSSGTPEGRDNEDGVRDESKAPTSSTAVVSHSTSICDVKYVILSTAVIHVRDSEGARKSCRVLLDGGSQVSFISRKFLESISIKPRSINISITGINKTVSRVTQIAQIRLESRVNSFTTSLECIVTEEITEKLPAFALKRTSFEFPRNIRLADPQFHIPADIDVLIGADLFWQILCIGRIEASQAHPLLQKTQFGWILAGRLGHKAMFPRDIRSFHATIMNVQLHEQLSRFWELESVPESTNFTHDETLCEKHFLSNVKQNEQGRYVVKLPCREEILNNLGESRDTALKRLYGLERRFKRDSNFQHQYSSFLEEYMALGHMKKVENSRDFETKLFYLPHHGVFKSAASSSKIRVVFDASSKSSSGVSLNDALMTGPVVQQDLMSILTRFRMYRYAFSADIVKMYRQILVDPSQTRLQRILWRNDSTTEVETYELVTVTYGTSSASYLATRCLKHLAERFHREYPSGSLCVQRDFYMDDLLTGADSIEEARVVRDKTIELLQRGRFELSKWASNAPELVSELRDQDVNTVNIGDEPRSHVLGMLWQQDSDTFCFSYRVESTYSILSKRVILSEVSRIFDPLGLLGPTVVLAKLIVQELWQAGTHWDESVPPGIRTRWLELKEKLPHINELSVTRCVKFDTKLENIQVHGFCDASERALGACVYVRTRVAEDGYRSELLCSKSRVAPLKVVSLPRLELAAALLLARLVYKVGSIFDLSNVKITLWSDSMITLHWISSPSRKWSTFVANRVGEIQRITARDSWRHVSTVHNPADILSRGLDPLKLANSSAWWHGPEFLLTSDERWPDSPLVSVDELPEQRGPVVASAAVQQSVAEELLSKFSSLEKICRILAYAFRFAKANRPSAATILVSPAETRYALKVICKSVQRAVFSEEYKTLSKGEAISATSKILSLSPFVDTEGLLRVGGRIKNSELDFNASHPILLPRNHELTSRVINYEHVRTGHAGIQATMASVRQRFWPISLRSATRRIIKKCVLCFKAKPIQSETLMGSLPAGRVSVSRAFCHSGVDYAGPLILRETNRRNARNTKAYVSIFVCLATRAVHIELVNDLTSDSFLGTLKRFIARRGKPSCIYSDNGTTFVGARRQIKEFYDALNSDQMQDAVKQFLLSQGTSWQFIPPNSPHFGGIWEATVKSAKYHLARIVGKAHLTFEEMLTTLSEIEAILNSRPLTQLSSDPNDLNYLSPGHFLVGTPLNSFPYSDIGEVQENRLVRWQRVEQLRQHFWRRWSTEYLQSLQERTKWKINKGQQLKIDQLVLLKQQGLAPLQWLLGRVEQVHPGSDGQVRTATVRTASGRFTRPWSRIAILPVDP